ncbi:DEAD/DEAH box helicase [Algoriphagus halophytocola]|uniref:DEAD/DEAH box helicase n=1 Tax=Algoriphagus halophytocola TaxID=2991499 RepID=A0ABY6MFC1_9BACT|nr:MULTISPECIES: DEAD/DEAH box helicase [unclassified Algoriphagus]UZD22512.1 DEAD/DEAH box helicase [Algoriphagus sp. TR-M5]WBL43774.1 DEAD/DEAH box helicase [Algoriphagus sp. TR-M9]
MNTNSNRNSRPSRNGRPSAHQSKGRPAQGQRSPKKKMVSKLDPNLLVKKAQPSGSAGFKSETHFDSLDLSSKLLQNLVSKGYQTMTYIQEQSVPALLEGRDLMGISNTGSGKTGAFLIPIIEQAQLDPRNFTALIVTPTRELALQIEEEFVSLSRGMNLYSATFIGGTNINTDIKTLGRKLQIIVGTPGRLLDLYHRKFLKLNQVNTLVLDEFDRMLDMGFVNDVKKLVAPMSKRNQTMLFSATLEPSQKSLISSLLNNPVEVKVNSGGTTSENVDQEVIRVPDGQDKFEVLENLFRKDDLDKVIIFTETKRIADKLSKKLNHSGIKSGLIHGNKSQNFRNRTIDEFKTGMTRVLVATDVAARGIDVADVTHVINYQLPMSMDSYIHRIGRTGRAGKTGKAITFVN